MATVSRFCFLEKKFLIFSDPGPERGDLPDDYVPVTFSEQYIRHPKIGLANAGRYTCKGSNQYASVTKDVYVEGIFKIKKKFIKVLYF